MNEESSKVMALLAEIPDPEIPVISIVELGIVRNVSVQGSRVEVTITPTYSGCPAMDHISDNIQKTLQSSGYKDIAIEMTYSPAWSTDWISDQAKQKLKEYGIAPPGSARNDEDSLVVFPKKPRVLACPFCESSNTKLTSEFGSTACKALWYCNSCQQPFEEFKAI